MHFPTDTNLLWDAIRKAIETCAQLSQAHGLSEWRQSAYHLRQFKKAYRMLQRLRPSTAKDETKRAAKRREIEQAHRHYLAQAEGYLERACRTRVRLLEIGGGVPPVGLEELERYLVHAERQIDQIRRRVLQGETIPHPEKVLSIFEPHTEWIVKGKAGVPVELGLRVAVVEDHHGFILHHRVMEKITDDGIAVAIVQETQARFPDLASISFDRGFHSPSNQIELKPLLDRVVLPKKGKRSAADTAREQDPAFIRLRRRHAAVESAINALEVHGLDRCPDQGLEGFKRYVALAVVARNIHRLGAVLRRQAQEKAARKRGPYHKAA